jgi:hypothetical protein
MTGYRRNFVAGGSFFFTVNLMERRLGLLTQHIDELRSAFRETRRHQARARAAGQGLAVFVISSHGETRNLSRGLGG